MIFIIIMEVLNVLIHRADDWALLEGLGVGSIPYRTLPYADDLVPVVRPNAQDLPLVRSVFSIFESAFWAWL
jgi:hypothetical protein